MANRPKTEQPQQLEHLGDGFFRINKHLLGPGKPTDGSDEDLLLGVITSPTIRGAQFLCGSMVFKDRDSIAATVLSNEEAARLGIHGMGGDLCYILVEMCPQTTPEERCEAMTFMVDFVKRLNRDVDKLEEELRAVSAQPAAA